MLPPAYHPGTASFPAYGHVQIPTGPPLAHRQFYPTPIFYWPYPSPPVSPTSYYAPALQPPPGALPAGAQAQQPMVSVKLQKSTLHTSMSNTGKGALWSEGPFYFWQT